MRRSLPLIIVALAGAITTAAAAFPPLTLPFDFSRHEIGLRVSVKGKPAYMILDSGVDPSVIDLNLAEQLKLPLNRKAAGEGSGEGSGHAEAIPSRIAGLQIGGNRYRDIEALAADLRSMSSVYGRPLQGVLGYRFLKDKTVLIDYPAKTVTIYNGANDGAPASATCRKRYAAPLRLFRDEHFPLMPDLRFGAMHIPATLDTGSNRYIGLYHAAMQNPQLRKMIVTTGRASGAGFRGSFESRTGKLNVPVSVGPFRLPAGAAVATISGHGSAEQLANIGNQTFAAMKVKLLLNYPQQRISLFGDCKS